MQALKKLFSAPATAVRNVAIAATGFAIANSANAAVDVAAVKTAMDANQASGEEVGGYVIMLVVALVVVGIIVSLVKKA